MAHTFTALAARVDAALETVGLDSGDAYLTISTYATGGAAIHLNAHGPKWSVTQARDLTKALGGTVPHQNDIGGETGPLSIIRAASGTLRIAVVCEHTPSTDEVAA